MGRLLAIATEIVGMVSIVVGVAMFSVPAAFITAGVLTIVAVEAGS